MNGHILLADEVQVGSANKQSKIRSNRINCIISDSFPMAPGTYNYTFQCLLPAGLPTSQQHEVGHILYGANVVLDIPVRIHLFHRINIHFTLSSEFVPYFSILSALAG